MLIHIVIFIGSSVKCGGVEFGTKDELTKQIRGSFETVLQNVAETSFGFKYSRDNGFLIVDFTYLEKPSGILYFYDSQIKVKYLESITFDFIITNYF